MKAVIRPMEPADAPGVAKLRTLVYPHHPEAYYADWHDSVWSWLETHPLSGGMERWVVAAGDEVVGHLAAVPQYYRVNGERAVAHTPADYQVLPQYGFQALSLMRKFFRTVENCVACDMVPAVITVQTRMGAVVAGDLQYRAKLLDVSRLPSPSLDDARALLGRDGDGPAEPPRPEDALPNRPRAPIPAPARVLMNRSLRVIDGTLGAAFVGNGMKVSCRGIEISAVSPVWVSMLATITVSVRVPSRPLPSSPPSSSRFSRGLPTQGSWVFTWSGRVAL